MIDFVPLEVGDVKVHTQASKTKKKFDGTTYLLGKSLISDNKGIAELFNAQGVYGQDVDKQYNEALSNFDVNSNHARSPDHVSSANLLRSADRGGHNRTSSIQLAAKGTL